jgi:hypothetical protein
LSPRALNTNLARSSDDWPTLDLVANRPASPNVNTQHRENNASQHLLVPEVVGCRFRYFDGLAWVSAWDSQQQHGLPRAVEVEFWLLTRNEINQHFDVGRGHRPDKQRITELPPDSKVNNQIQPIPARHYRRILLLGPGLVADRANVTVPHARTGTLPSGSDQRRGPS